MTQNKGYYRFEFIADYCSDFGRKTVTLRLWVYGATYTVHLGLIGKLVVDFLLVIDNFFR